MSLLSPFRKAPAFAVMLAVLLAAIPATASSILVSTIVGNCCGGETVTGSNYVLGSLGVSFIPAATYILDDVKVEVSALGAPNFTGSDPFFNISVYSSVPGIGGQVPGTLLATIGTKLTAPAGGGLVVASGAMPVISQGTQYWIVLSPFDASSAISLEDGSVADLSQAATFAAVPTAWASSIGTQQFEVDGDLVVQSQINFSAPEPASWMFALTGLILTGLIAAGFRARKRA